MNIETTTVAVVKEWSGSQDDIDEQEPLEALGHHYGGNYYPDVCLLLLNKLLPAFPQYPNLKNELPVTLFYDPQYNPTGTITTTAVLVKTIADTVASPFTRFMSLIKAPFRLLTKGRKR